MTSPTSRASAIAATALVLSLLASALPVQADPAVEISGVAIDARATSALVTWTTNVPATTVAEWTAGGQTRTASSTNLTLDHAVTLTHLSPGTTVAFTLRSSDGATEATHAGTASTTTDLTYYLHNVGTPAAKSADEFDSAGDVDGRGYNGFGAVVATAESALGTSLLGTFDVYPTLNGGLRISPGAAEAKLFVKFSLSGPTVNGVGTNVLTGAPADAVFRVSLLSGQDVVASGSAEVLSVPGANAWHEVNVSIPLAAAEVPVGALSIKVSADRATAGFSFGLEGDHASRVSVPVLAGGPAAPVRQTDFTQGARVVVAVIDSGINPYHPIFQRPGAQMPLTVFTNASDGAQPRPLDLATTGNYTQRVQADNATWNGIGPQELVWFRGTNVLAVSIRGPEHVASQTTINQTAAEQTAHRVRDVNGHGTATASTVLQNFPDAVIVMVQITTGGGLADATAWAASQPWIDVLSTSWGAQANVPTNPLGATPTYTRQAYDAGKVVVNSAGNDPSPLPFDNQDGPHWVLAATGSQAEGRGKEVLSANVFPDYVADYTVEGAVMDNVDDVYGTIGGTSFSCPTVAGTVAGIVHGLRAAKGHSGGIVAGELAPGVTNRDVRAALNKTAILDPWDGYVVGLHYNGDHTNPPGAPWLTAQWGHVDDKVIGPATAAILAGNYTIPPEKALAAEWKALTYEYRAVYWTTLRGFP